MDLLHSAIDRAVVARTALARVDVEGQDVDSTLHRHARNHRVANLELVVGDPRLGGGVRAVHDLSDVRVHRGRGASIGGGLVSYLVAEAGVPRADVAGDPLHDFRVGHGLHASRVVIGGNPDHSGDAGGGLRIAERLHPSVGCCVESGALHAGEVGGVESINAACGVARGQRRGWAGGR